MTDYDYEEIYEMYMIEGKSYSQIAELCEMSVKDVKTIIRHYDE